MKRRRYAIALTLAVGLAGCGGHGSSTSIPSVQSGGTNAVGSGTSTTASLQKTTLVVRVPANFTPSDTQRRTPKYVSPSTLGATFTVYGALATPPPSPTAVADLSPSSPSCTANPDGSRNCSVQVQAPVGNDDFIVNLYDQAPVNGVIPQGANLLSTSTLQYVILAGQVNTLPLTLNGVPAAIVLGPPGFLVPPNQTGTFNFTVNAKDADGNYIVGPGNYAQPITLSISGDPNNTISLSTTTITSPATSTVTATYNGGALTGTATITGSASGATSGSLTVQASSSVTGVTIVVPAPSTTSSQTQTVYQQGGNWTIPDAGGYNGSFQYSTNNAPSGTTITVTTSTTGPGTLPNPQPAGTPLVYVSYSVNNTTTFTQGIQSLTLTLPNSISTSGQTFYETVYDLTAGTNVTPASNTSVAGTGSSTITIGPGPIQNPIQTTWPVNENYLIVINQASSAGLVTLYAPSTSSSQPFDIALGPDGNLWFTEQAGNSIGRATPSGSITEFPIPTPSSGPMGITAGPDGNLWFVENPPSPGVGKIARITPNGQITEFPTPTSNSGPIGIVAGPDGNLWFTEFAASKIGRITPSGTITEFSIPNSNGWPYGITRGPDGNLWFTEYIGNSVAKITPSGNVTEFPVPASPSGGPMSIAAGPDGNLWFTDYQSIWKITTAGALTQFATGDYFDPGGITTGPDGNLWITAVSSSLNSEIIRSTTSGALTRFPVPVIQTGYVQMGGITTGPDSNLWFADTGGNRIGKIVP